MECLFCKIARKELPSEIVYEDETLVAFKDICPKAQIHLLIVPRKHIPSVDHLAIGDKCDNMSSEQVFHTTSCVLCKKRAQDVGVGDRPSPPVPLPILGEGRLGEEGSTRWGKADGRREIKTPRLSACLCVPSRPR